MCKQYCLRVFFLLWLCGSAAGITLAQQPGTFRVSGRVLDSSDVSPVPFAGVGLRRNGNIVASALTDSAGWFQLVVKEWGTAELMVSSLGYVSYVSPPMEIPGTGEPIRVLLKNKASALELVTVMAKKKLMQTQGDKLVYNASADITNKAGTAADVLKKVPMLTVGSDGEVKMRGNANLKVLLNGQPSGILAKNLKEALKSIPANTIESVEVITSPSAKYEAEGAAGIINIITKKRTEETGGSVNLSGGNLAQSAGISLGLARNKFDFNLNLNASNETERRYSVLTRTSLHNGESVGELFQENRVKQHDRGLYGELGLDYRPDSTQKLGAVFSFWQGGWPSTGNLYNRYRDTQGTIEYTQKNAEKSKDTYYEVALNYQKRFRRKGQELQFSGLLGNDVGNTEYSFNQYTLSGYPYLREVGPNRSRSLDINLQADYTHPLGKSGKHLLETGLRFSRNSSGSRYRVKNNEGSPGSKVLSVIPGRSDEMTYFQNIYAAYLSLKFETNNRWTFRAGLRGEGTQLRGRFKGAGSSFGSLFGNLVPSVQISKELDDQHAFKLSYTERIRRPWIWDLNPFVNAADPRNLTTGNPQLRPEKTRTLEFAYNYLSESGFMLNNALYFSANSNAIESLTTVDSLGISRTMPRNVAANKRLGANINAAFEMSENWMLNAGFEFYHVWFNSPALQVKNDASFYSVNLNFSYTFPKDFTLQASGDYGNGYITLQGRNSADWSYGFSIRKEFLNRKIAVMLGVSNPFQRRMLQRSVATAPSFRSHTRNYYYNRSIRLTFSWTF